MLVIVPCGGKKASEECEAKDMYQGPYFKACLAYAQKLSPWGNIVILSAKYGLLPLTARISPYNLRMGDIGCVNYFEVRKQAQLMKLIDEQEVIALGGEDYTGVCRKVWPHCQTPLAGVGAIGKQLQWLKQQTEAV